MQNTGEAGATIASTVVEFHTNAAPVGGLQGRAPTRPWRFTQHGERVRGVRRDRSAIGVVQFVDPAHGCKRPQDRNRNCAWLDTTPDRQPLVAKTNCRRAWALIVDEHSVD